jgi:hypothetical protein
MSLFDAEKMFELFFVVEKLTDYYYSRLIFIEVKIFRYQDVPS